MIQHPRKPAALILLLAAGVATAYLSAADEPQRQAAAVAAAQTGLSIEQIEKAVATGEADAVVWFAWAEHQRQQRQFAPAADAYGKVLEKEPFNRDARLNRASCLAQAGRRDDLLMFLRELLYSDARLVVDVIDRPECRGFLSDPRFTALAKEARSQAMD